MSARICASRFLLRRAMLLQYDNYEKPSPEEIRQETRLIRLMDDGYAKLFFYQNIRDTQLILRIIMNKPDLEVKSVELQKHFYASGTSHGVIFDVYAVDSDGTQYDIEIQNDSEGASIYRAVFNSAMMTVNSLKKRERYSELTKREHVVIFITLYDVLRENLPVYTIKRKCMETGEIFGDGTCIIYVNTAHKDYTTAIGKLIHDFRCENTEELCYRELAETASCIYQDEGGRFMKSLEALEKINMAEGEARGEARAYTNFAISLIKDGLYALNKIAELCHMTLEQVQELAASVKA